MSFIGTRIAASLAMVFLGVTLAAQTPDSASSWRRVEALPPQTKVHVKADHRKVTCRIAAVTDDQLTCSQIVFARSEIRRIRLAREGTSTAGGLLIGGGVGAGLGIGIGAAINAGDKGNLLHVSAGKATGVGAGVGAVLGIVAGSLAGYGTDFFGVTVYRR